MGHLNFPIFPVWDSLASETSSEELNCCIFGESRLKRKMFKLVPAWVKMNGPKVLR